MIVKFQDPHVDPRTKTFMTHAFRSAGASAMVREALQIEDDLLAVGSRRIRLDEYRRIIVVGAGKASAYMAFGLEERLRDRITDGLVISHFFPELPMRRIQVRTGNHPLPGVDTLTSSVELVKLLKSAQLSEADLVIGLISGGASSLFEVLREGTDLNAYLEEMRTLYSSGAPIRDLNRFRSSYSSVKGGKLLEWIHPADFLGLIISDVTHNDLSVVGSGPTFPTAEMAERFGGYRHSNFLIGSNSSVLEKCRKYLTRELKVGPVRITEDLDLPLEEWADEVVTHIESRQAGVWLAGGEVTVPFNPALEGVEGGRAQHLVLSVLQKLRSNEHFFRRMPRFEFAALASDGKDGSSTFAGAFISDRTVIDPETQNINLAEYLQKCDSTAALKKTKSLVWTGHTGTNVADLYYLRIF